MQIASSGFRIIFLSIAISIAAWISALFSGGLFVFGPRLRSFGDFCLFVVPVLALPVALISLWKSWIAAIAWASLICAFFGVQIYLVWPEIASISENGTKPWLFMLVQALLIAASLFRRNQTRGNGAVSVGRSE
jgi:hypothetical protein